jgi:glycosyltransferase involved in cell wall biosynthesis
LYNSAMRILLMNLYFPPDTSATARMALSVAEPLAVRHEVTVLCGRPSYDPTERRPWRISLTEQLGRMRVIRVGSTDYARFNMTKRVLNYLSYVALAVPRALFVPCDVVLAMTDPPFQGIVGACVAMLKGKPFVYNIRDLYPDMALGGSLVAPGRLARVWETMHRWALQRADCVIALGDDMRARIIGKGVVVVRDGAEISAVGAVAASVDAEVVTAIRGDARFVLVHAGNLGFYGDWDTLVAAAGELAGDGVRLVFVGDGAQREEVRRRAAGFRNVIFLPFFPGSKVASVLAAADAHVITVKRGLEGVVVPSKLYGILVAGKAIVAVAARETDVATLGIRRGFAVCCEPGDVAGLLTAVRGLMAEPEKLRRMGAAALAAAPGYDRAGEAGKFLQVMEGLGRKDLAS